MALYFFFFLLQVLTLKHIICNTPETITYLAWCVSVKEGRRDHNSQQVSLSEYSWANVWRIMVHQTDKVLHEILTCTMNYKS